MAKTITIQHPKEIVLFTISRFFERAAFYGIRSLLVLYMIKSSLALSEEKAFEIYGWFVSSFIFANVLGALLGDLVFGSKGATILGGCLQALGAFVLCVPNEIVLFTGMLLIAIGNGFYSPNIIALVGKVYLDRVRLLDSALTILYIIVNIGAFVGGYYISTLSEWGFKLGFIVGGIFMLVSLIPIILYKQLHKQKDYPNFYVYSSKNVLVVIVAILLGGLFWILFDISNASLSYIQMKFDRDASLASSMIINSIGPMLVVFFGIIFSIVWSFLEIPKLTKLIVGFVLASFSCIVLILSTSSGNISIYVIFGISILFMSLAELFISPIITSIILKNTNPKYFALIFSAISIPYGIYAVFNRLFLINNNFSLNNSLLLGSISFGVLSIMMFVIALLKRQKLLLNK